MLIVLTNMIGNMLFVKRLYTTQPAVHPTLSSLVD